MGWPEYTGDAAFVPVTSNPRTPQVVDEYGNRMFYGTTDNTNATFPIDSRIVEFQQYGVLNGAFARGPQDPNHDITDINALPDWTGPVTVSGGAITAQWVASSTYPSGQALRLTVNAGAAGDEAYFEQIVPIGGSLFRTLDDAVRLVAYRVTASDNNFSATLALQYLDATGATTGAAMSASATLAVDATAYFTAIQASNILTAAPPANARSLRVRIGVKRSTAAAVATLTVDLTDVRIDTGRPYALFPDISDPTKSAGSMSQTSGVLSMRSGIWGVTVDSTSGVVTVGDALYATSNIELGHVSDTTLHRSGAGDVTIEGNVIYRAGGTDVPVLDGGTGSSTAGGARTNLGLVIGTNVQAWDADLDTLAASTVATGQTFTPALAFATVGSSTWATTTAVGFYTRLLDRVIFHGFYQGVPTNGTAAGNLTLTGLPVTSNATANSSSIVSIVAQGWTKAGYTAVGGQINASSTIMVFPATGSAQAISNLVVADIPTGGTVIVRFNGVYFI